MKASINEIMRLITHTNNLDKLGGSRLSNLDIAANKLQIVLSKDTLQLLSKLDSKNSFLYELSKKHTNKGV